MISREQLEESVSAMPLHRREELSAPNDYLEGDEDPGEGLVMDGEEFEDEEDRDIPDEDDILDDIRPEVEIDPSDNEGAGADIPEELEKKDVPSKISVKPSKAIDLDDDDMFFAR
jgi:hypothetical protein